MSQQRQPLKKWEGTRWLQVPLTLEIKSILMQRAVELEMSPGEYCESVLTVHALALKAGIDADAGAVLHREECGSWTAKSTWIDRIKQAARAIYTWPYATFPRLDGYESKGRAKPKDGA